jgi:hypothetical protein
MTPGEIAQTLALFVDVLIPGDDLFPPASVAGTQGLSAERLRWRYGDGVPAELAARLNDGESFIDASPERRIEIVAAFERDDPVFFGNVYAVVNYSYYQQPVVVSAIQALGHEYRANPQPDGYILPPHSMTPGVDVPLAPKGFYKWTEAVERLPETALAGLPLPAKDY